MNTTETTTPTAYCQACGRPLTAAEIRNIGGNTFCEPCLAARMVPAAAPYAYTGPNPGQHSPVIAGLLGLIPGVGAMYNGQFIKGIVHVLIFVGLIAATDHFGPLGILIGVWYVYMIFDAVQTAQAIRMGMPLPDPLGLNNIGAKLGMPGQPPVAGAPPVAPYPPTPGVAQPPSVQPPVALAAFHGVASQAPPVDPAQVPPPYPVPPPMGRRLPTGAIILIVLGVFFALGTMGDFSERWVSHGWPVLLIVLGAWLLFRNMWQGGTR